MTQSPLVKGLLKAQAMVLIVAASSVILTGCGGAGSADTSVSNTAPETSNTDETNTDNNTETPPAHSLSLTAQPASATIYEGQSNTFTLAVANNYPVTISWFKNGSKINGATGTSYTVAAATANSAGTYSCSVTDGTLTVACNNASLTVNQIVRITTQPSNQAVNEGVNAALTVAATGTGPISYQWYLNNSPVTGGTAATLSLNNITTNKAGNYYCVVSNQGSTATSSTASVSVAANVAGRAQIRWDAPTKRVDGTNLTSADISGYELFYSPTSSGAMTQLMTLNSSELSVVVEELDQGTHYFALATIDSQGVKSNRSSTFSVTIN